jgi:hypothetical protein
VPLVIHTVCGGVGSIAAFHCRSGGTMTASLSPAAIDDLAGDDFVVRLYRAGTVTRIRRAGAVAVSLEERGFEIATVAQVIEGVAVLGSLGHYHGAGHVARHAVSAPGVHAIDLRAGGRIGMWCAQAPTAVLVAGKALPAARQSFDRKTGVLVLTIPEGAALRVDVHFAQAAKPGVRGDLLAQARAAIAAKAAAGKQAPRKAAQQSVRKAAGKAARKAAPPAAKKSTRPRVGKPAAKKPGRR